MTPWKLEALQKFSCYNLSKEFGWTPGQIMELPQSWFDDYLEIKNLIAVKEKEKNDELLAKMKNWK